jgi:hypothetical protein
MKKTKITLLLTLLTYSFSFGQNEVNDSVQETNADYIEPEEELETYSGTRIINGHSVETLHKGVLEFRIEHKFGDIAGNNGGVNTLYGIDNVSDIRIAFEYGITDKFMIGLGRSKGTGAPYRSLLDGFIKYRLLHQDKKGMPLSLSLLGTTSYSYMPVSSIATDVSAFPKSIYRFAYCSQINLARKFGNKFSLSIIPTLVYRNYVAADDINALFSIGSAVSYAVNSKVSVIVEYYNNIQKETVRSNYQNSLSAAVEWITFGHNFKVYLTNAGGFGETQFIPYTNTNWTKGQFRLGFCISRKYMRE